MHMQDHDNFDWNFQELMKFEQEVSDCTWMINYHIKINLEIQIREFFYLLQEFNSKSFEF
jgi:hypothetical protein